ncbi:MAG: phage major capsid protein [Melioribacteraceae bacterium]
MEKSEFEALVKDTTTEAVKGIMDANNEKLADVIDAKIKEAVVDVEKRIVVGKEEMEKDKKAGFKSFTHFCVDIAKASASGFRKVSSELEKWETHCTKAAGSPSQNVSDGEAGGYLVPEEFRQNLLVATREKNEFMSRCTQIPMQSNVVKIPYVNGFDKSGNLVYGNVAWQWTQEEEDFTAKNVKFGYINLALHKVTGMAYVSDEILRFSPMSMENILQEGFIDGFNYEMNRVILKGTGAGQPQGILSAPATISIAAESGQTSTQILWENVIKMYARCINPANAIWIANPNTLPQLASMSLAIGTGGIPVFMPAGGAAGQPYATLFGLPLVFSHHAKSLGTAGDLVLADMKQYLLGMLAGDEGMRFDTSMHIKFETDQQAFRFAFYVAGQSWMPTYLTPPEATSDTLSPFIMIATR